MSVYAGEWGNPVSYPDCAPQHRRYNGSVVARLRSVGSRMLLISCYWMWYDGTNIHEGKCFYEVV